MKTESFKYFNKYFHESEAWGDITQVKFWHIHHLFQIRLAMKDDYNWPMIIHCSYEKTGHTNKSYHYKGMATDFHFHTDTDFSEQYNILKKTLSKLGLLDLCGLGVYPTWNNPGFHLDGRGYPLQWIRANGKYYFGEENVIQLLDSHKTTQQKIKEMNKKSESNS